MIPAQEEKDTDRGRGTGPRFPLILFRLLLVPTALAGCLVVSLVITWAAGVLEVSLLGPSTSGAAIGGVVFLYGTFACLWLGFRASNRRTQGWLWRGAALQTFFLGIVLLLL